MNINAETRLTSFFLLFEGYVQKISKINIERENRKMENIVLSCYLVDFGTEIFGRFLVNQLRIFARDFWGFLLGIFGGSIGSFWWGFLPEGFCCPVHFVHRSFWIYQYLT